MKLSNKEKIFKEYKLPREGLNLRDKFLMTILPVVLISLIILSGVITVLSQKLILSQSHEQMQAQLESNASQISDVLDSVKTETNSLASFVGSTYQTIDIEDYKVLITKIIENNDMILGSGIWFEPYVIESSKKYYGPYWYKKLDGTGTWNQSALIETWEYSDQKYNYFNQEYYQNAKNLSETTITEPYYDETTGLVMASCSAPIFDASNKYIGCITIDVKLTFFETLLTNASKEHLGSLWLLDGKYNYIHHPDYKNAVAQGVSLQNSKELHGYVTDIQIDNKGSGAIDVSGHKQFIYWMSVPNTAWKIGLTVSKAELLHDSQELIYISIILAAIAIIVCTVLLVIYAFNISKIVKIITRHLVEISNGDFQKIDKKPNNQDEFGLMINTINALSEKYEALTTELKKSSDNINTVVDDFAEIINLTSDNTDKIEATLNKICNNTSKREQLRVLTSDLNALSNQAQYTVTKSKTLLESINAAPVKVLPDDTPKELIILMQQVSDLSDILNSAVKNIGSIGFFVTTMSEDLENISNNSSKIQTLSINIGAKASRYSGSQSDIIRHADEINKLAMQDSDLVFNIKNHIAAINKYTKRGIEAANKITELQKGIEELTNTLNDQMKQIAGKSYDDENMAKISEYITTYDKLQQDASDIIKQMLHIICSVSPQEQSPGKLFEEHQKLLGAFSTYINEIKTEADKTTEFLQFVKK